MISPQSWATTTRLTRTWPSAGLLRLRPQRQHRPRCDHTERTRYRGHYSSRFPVQLFEAMDDLSSWLVLLQLGEPLELADPSSVAGETPTGPCLPRWRAH